MNMKLIYSVAIATTLSLSTAASAQIFGGHNGRTLLGATIGAGLGGALGSNLAGGGVQDEGTAIGAVLGGLAGAAIANQGSSRYGGYNYGYGGGNGGLIGAGLGAVAGGVLGSNLAGGGVQDEGTAIGALVGGLVGYGVGNQFGGSNQFQGGMTGQPYIPAPAQYGTFGGTFIAPPALPGPQFIPGGNVLVGSYTVPQYTQHVYQPAPQIAPVTTRVIYHQPVIRRTIRQVVQEPVHYIEQAPTIVAPTRTIYVPSQTTTLPAPVSGGPYCYAGSSKRYDDRGYLISSSSCN